MLMSRFYRELLVEKRTPAQSLAARATGAGEPTALAVSTTGPVLCSRAIGSAVVRGDRRRRTYTGSSGRLVATGSALDALFARFASRGAIAAGRVRNASKAPHQRTCIRACAGRKRTLA